MNPESNPSTETIMRAVRSQQRFGAVLAAIACALGILAIVASVTIAYASTRIIRPMERLLMEDYPRSVQQAGKNAEGKPPLSRDELDFRHAQVTAAHGKVMILMDLAVTLLAVGTVVILLIVILNRRVTLRQINVSLAQISEQIKELQRRQGSGS